MNRWNLEGVDFEMSSGTFACNFLARRKIQEIEDAYDAASIVYMRERDIFIENNIEILSASGKLEKIMIDFYTMLHVPMRDLDIYQWEYLFDFCDRDRLLAEGDALPKELGSEFTIYRGQNLDVEPGISWTLSKEIAAFFVQRSEDLLNAKGKAGIIDMKVNIDDILYYYNGREEQEIVVSPEMILWEGSL